MVDVFKAEVKRLGLCRDGLKKMNEIHTMDDFVELLFSPQGIEFCMDNNFPSIELLETMDSSFLHLNGIYYNESVYSHNRERLFLVGCDAELDYNKKGVPFTVVSVDSTLYVTASDWATVFVNSNNGYQKLTQNNAKII